MIFTSAANSSLKGKKRVLDVQIEIPDEHKLKFVSIRPPQNGSSGIKIILP